MSIELSDVETIAHLARLHLDDSEKAEAATSINNILGLIDQMQSIATEDVTPLAHAFDATQRLRKDEVSEINQREQLQEIAPSVEKGLFLVPKVLE